MEIFSSSVICSHLYHTSHIFNTQGTFSLNDHFPKILHCADSVKVEAISSQRTMLVSRIVKLALKCFFNPCAPGLYFPSHCSCALTIMKKTFHQKQLELGAEKERQGHISKSTRENYQQAKSKCVQGLLPHLIWPPSLQEGDLPWWVGLCDGPQLQHTSEHLGDSNDADSLVSSLVTQFW